MGRARKSVECFVPSSPSPVPSQHLIAHQHQRQRQLQDGGRPYATKHQTANVIDDQRRNNQEDGGIRKEYLKHPSSRSSTPSRTNSEACRLQSPYLNPQRNTCTCSPETIATHSSQKEYRPTPTVHGTPLIPPASDESPTSTRIPTLIPLTQPTHSTTAIRNLHLPHGRPNRGPPNHQRPRRK